MPREKKAEKKTLCRGGGSFNCSRADHEQGTLVVCEFCKTYIGCSRCTERATELICLRCHDWATTAGKKKHGPMVKIPEIREEAWQLINMRYRGSITEEDATKLFAELFAKGV